MHSSHSLGLGTSARATCPSAGRLALHSRGAQLPLPSPHPQWGRSSARPFIPALPHAIAITPEHAPLLPTRRGRPVLGRGPRVGQLVGCLPRPAPAPQFFCGSGNIGRGEPALGTTREAPPAEMTSRVEPPIRVGPSGDITTGSSPTVEPSHLKYSGRPMSSAEKGGEGE